MINLFYIIIISLLAYLIGKSFLVLLNFKCEKLAEFLLLSITSGLGIIAFTLFFFGLFGLLYKNLIVILLLISLILLLLFNGKKEYFFLKTRISRINLHFSFLMWTLISISAIYILYNLLICLTPVLNGDSIAWYLSIPKQYIIEHGILNEQITEDFISSNLPQNIYMLSVLGMLIQSEILSQLILGWLAGFLSMTAIYVLARNFTSRKISLIAAVIFYTMPTLSWLIFSAKLDLGYTLFELTFWYLFVKWIKSKEKKHLYISAIFLGFAIGSKYFSLIALTFAACFVIILMVVNKKKIKEIIYTTFIFSIISLLIGSPSYIKTFFFTGDPFFPFFSNPDIVKGEGYGIYNGVLDYFQFQYNMIFKKDFLVNPISYPDKAIGFLPILFLPFILFQWINYNKYIKKIFFLFLSYYLLLSIIVCKSIWPFPRHFLPAIGLLVVVNSVGLKKALTLINKKIIYLILLLSIFGIVFLSNIGYAHSRFSRIKLQLNYVIGKISKTEYLQTTLFNNGRHMNYEMLKYVKNMPVDTRIMTLDYGNGYYVERPFVKKLYTYTIRDLDSLLSEFKKDKITHIYFSKPIMEKYVKNWQNGHYSVILKGINNNKLILENQAGNQFLYRINY